MRMKPMNCIDFPTETQIYLKTLKTPKQRGSRCKIGIIAAAAAAAAMHFFFFLAIQKCHDFFTASTCYDKSIDVSARNRL